MTQKQTTYSFRLKGAIDAGTAAKELEVPGLRLIKTAEGQKVQGHVNSYGDYIEVVIYDEKEEIREPPIVKPTKADIEAKLRLAGRID